MEITKMQVPILRSPFICITNSCRKSGQCIKHSTTAPASRGINTAAKPAYIFRVNNEINDLYNMDQFLNQSHKVNSSTRQLPIINCDNMFFRRQKFVVSLLFNGMINNLNTTPSGSINIIWLLNFVTYLL